MFLLPLCYLESVMTAYNDSFLALLSGLEMVYIDTFGFRRMLRTAMEQWVNKRAVL